MEINNLIWFLIFIIMAAVIIAGLIFAFWIWMIIDCAKRNFKNNIDKVVWILVIVFLSVLGASIYYFAVKVADRKAEKIKPKKK